MMESIAEILLDLGAVTLSPEKPFTWASGLKSPIYCDNRLIISHVESRDSVIQGFVDLFHQQEEKVDVVAGTATAGIPHAAWLADRTSLPLIYIRSTEKKHGQKNQIEGRLKPDQRVFLVEDLISTGGSSIKAANAVLDRGANIVKVASIFTYGFEMARQAFEEQKLAFTSLTDLETLLPLAVRKGLISEDNLEELMAWSRNPRAWSNRWIQTHGQK